MPVDEHPLREGVRDNTNHYVTGRDGGRDIDLRRFAREGMELFGLLDDLRRGRHAAASRPTCASTSTMPTASTTRINASIDRFIAANGIEAPPALGLRARVASRPRSARGSISRPRASPACCGASASRPISRWVDAPVFNGRGHPVHTSAASRRERGCYFLGLPWLHTWGSGRFSGVARDAEFLAEAIAARRAELRAEPEVAPPRLQAA